MAWLQSLLDRPDQDDIPGGPGPSGPDPATPPAPPGDGYFKTGSGGGGGAGAGGFDFSGLTAAPTFNFPAAPVFSYPDFEAPTAESILNTPSFQARLRAGSDALERSAAAKGTLRTGGTLKGIYDYGRNFSGSEYQQGFDNAYRVYDTNRQTARDRFAPGMARYQFMNQAELAAKLAQYQRVFDIYRLEHSGSGGGPDIPPFNWDGGEDEDDF